jgi:hypothetical protein
MREGVVGNAMLSDARKTLNKSFNNAQQAVDATSACLHVWGVVTTSHLLASQTAH